jgi:hypothetical protein
MYNDFKGDANDFAMVVPVPVVLKKNDIRVVNETIFNTLNEYSKPKLVQFYDEDPCNPRRMADINSESVTVTGVYDKGKPAGIVPTVKVEARYLIGEYDIVILSASESEGLKTWLNENGYALPKGAETVLEPYIKSKLKFFVAKVNAEQKAKLQTGFLRPIQISFRSPKFMLPIRLGMANADGDQDLIVYALTRKGRVECSNYRTLQMPTQKKVPLFIQQDFGVFYSNLFEHFRKKQGENVVLQEYAWNVSPYAANLKCDPCMAAIPSITDLTQAGVWWLNGTDWNDYSNVDEEDEAYYNNNRNVFFTRMHIRYNRASFAQDPAFLVTPNTEPFQTSYIITHPANLNRNCTAAGAYLKELKKRRKEELQNLFELTGKTYENWNASFLQPEENSFVKDNQAGYADLANSINKNAGPGGNAWLFGAGLLALGVFVYMKQKAVFNL